MIRLTTAFTVCVLCYCVTASAQYRPNYTAERQGIPYRSPSYGDYYVRRHNQLPPYSAWPPQLPGSDFRTSRGISNRASWVPVYVFYNPVNTDQLLTANLLNEFYSGMLGYVPDGSFYVSPTGGPGMVPLYRYLGPNSMHSFTTMRAGMGYAQLESVLGYVETRQTRGSAPLHGWYDPFWDRYVVTISRDTEQQQYLQYLGVLGYVVPGE